MNETRKNLILNALKGSSKGAMAGVTFSLLTGAAIVAKAPVWVPAAGLTVISMATVKAYFAMGGALGAFTSAFAGYRREKKIAKEFEEKFGF